MTKSRLVVILSFVLAFAAGLAAGLLAGRGSGSPHGRSYLTRKLNLTPQQREQMRKIWAESMGQIRQQREVLEKERDQAVRAILTEEQQEKYDEIMRDFSSKVAALSETRRKTFQEAVEQTKKILNESQRRKYEELLKKEGEWYRSRHEGSRPQDPDSPGPPHRGEMP